MNLAPPLLFVSTHALPPRALACSCTIASPRPLPVLLREAVPRANRSKIRSRSLCATPAPLSSTTIRNEVWSPVTISAVAPPAWSRAFSSRFKTIRSMRRLSRTVWSSALRVVVNSTSLKPCRCETRFTKSAKLTVSF